MSLPAHIRNNLGAVVREWQAFAVTLLPSTSQLSSLALRDHAAPILLAIAADVETVQSAEESIEKSRGRRTTLTHVTDTAAQIHGALRQQAGFNISQLAAEYRALRSSVLRSWRATRISLPTDEMMAARFHEAIDECLAESVERYSLEVQRGQNLFIGMIGHDIRTPLAAVSMSAALLKRHVPQDSITLASLGRIERSAATIDTMVADLLKFARIGPFADLPLCRSTSDLNLICATAINDVNAAYPGTNLVYETGGTALGPWDAHRMGQVLRNLLSNAVAYGARNSEIALRMTQDQKGASIVVENSGPDIPDDQLARIFDPYTRLDSSCPDGDANAHLGLGLYIVREIIAAHQGVVWVNSFAGTTSFHIALPNHVFEERPEAALPVIRSDVTSVPNIDRQKTARG